MASAGESRTERDDATRLVRKLGDRVQQAYVCGVSTRRVDQLVKSLSLRISRSEVSCISAGLDEKVEALRQRPLEGRYPYLFADAKVEKIRAGGRVVRRCVVIVHDMRDRPLGIIGLDAGEAENRGVLA